MNDNPLEHERKRGFLIALICFALWWKTIFFFCKLIDKFAHTMKEIINSVIDTQIMKDIRSNVINK